MARVHIPAPVAPTGFAELAARFPDAEIRGGRLRGCRAITEQLTRELPIREAALAAGKLNAGAIRPN